MITPQLCIIPSSGLKTFSVKDKIGNLFYSVGCMFSFATTQLFQWRENSHRWWVNKHGFPGGSAVKNLLANAGDANLISESGRSLGVGNSNPLQYSCLGNPMDRGAWWASVNGSQRVKHNLVTKQQEQLIIIIF